MGMSKNFQDILRVFRFDEELNRLLYYLPESYIDNRKDPLDPSLPNIWDIDTDWSIRDDRIMNISKSDDLVDKKICRIYVYAGGRRPINSYHTANQEITIDILCHDNYEKDYRSLRISDRINQLLIKERITGITKIDYVNGRPIAAPNAYIGYRHIYDFGSAMK